MADRVHTLHSSIFKDGRLPLSISEGSRHKCSICFKSGEYAYIVAHMQTHEKTAVCYGGYKIYRCKGGCTKCDHYHCCYCTKIVVRPNVFLTHVEKCKSVAPNLIASASINSADSKLSTPPSVSPLPPAFSSSISMGSSQSSPPRIPAATKIQHQIAHSNSYPKTITLPKSDHLSNGTNPRLVQSKPQNNTAAFKISTPPHHQRSHFPIRNHASLHSTIFKDGRLPAPISEGSQHKCSICFKSGEYAYIVAHMQTHEKTAVSHRGYKIYRCKGDCTKCYHYHCCYCTRIVVRPNVFLAHVEKCKFNAPNLIPTASDQQCSLQNVCPPSVSPLPPAVWSSISIGSSQSSPHCIATIANIQHPIASSNSYPNAITLPKNDHLSNGGNPKLVKSKAPKIPCAFCNLNVNPKNLKVHIQRCHSSKSSHHSLSQCVVGVEPISRLVDALTLPPSDDACSATSINRRSAVSVNNTDASKEGWLGSSRQTSRRASVVWKYFTKKQTVPSAVTCKICKFTLKYSKSTSSMHAHLKGHQRKLTGQLAQSSRHPSISKFTKRPHLTQKREQEITSLLADFIVKDIAPLSAVRGEGFRQLLKNLEPAYDVPSSRTLWNTVKRQFDSLREDIMKEMKGRSVSLTTDLWTSAAADPYVTITAHYITDGWEPQSRVLRTSATPEKHTAVNIARRLSEVTREWGIKVFCTVHGSASNVNLAVELGEFPNDLGCSGHTLQQAIETGFILPDVAKAIDAARRVVSHFRHSELVASALTRQQERLGIRADKLMGDCPARWNSTFIMLRQLLEQRIAVQAVLSDETVTKPSVQKSLAMQASQWKLAEQVVVILEPLAEATEAMRGEPHAGFSFIYPVICNMINNSLRPEKSDLVAVRAFKVKVRKQLETGFQLDSDDLPESIPVVACLLDVRFKHLQFLSATKREAAQSHLNALLEDEAESLAATALVSDGELIEWKKAKLERDLEQLFSPQSGRGELTYSGVHKEVRDYLQTAQIPSTQNPLLWWAKNEDRFPRLAKLSKRYLAVPATSTPSSLDGSTVTPQRASLHPAHVDALVFLHANRARKTKTLTEIVTEQDSDYD